MAGSKTQKEENRSYLARDFASFKSALTSYARNYFSDQNFDFSDASLGGMFVELAAYVGDNLSFFLDHQFLELNPQTATEVSNLVAHAKNAGVSPAGAAPASVMIKLYLEVPATLSSGEYIPLESALPEILEGTVVNSSSGVKFSTVEDIVFAEKDADGNYFASIQTSQFDASGNPSYFIMTRQALAVAGEVKIQSVVVGPGSPFLRVTLGSGDISDILSVKDSNDNDYYEVDFLTQNTVFRKTKNLSSDLLEVPSRLELVAAPRRFVRDTNFLTSRTTLPFGAGDGTALDDDIIPDPSDLALPLFGRQTMKRFSIDPRNLLKTKTLGISPKNTTLTIKYRAGGGMNTNINIGSINTISSARTRFPGNPTATISSNVVNSLDVTNEEAASGGANAMNVADLRAAIFSARNEQSRIVSQNDLLARIYTLPSEFGRVFRAAVRKNSRNPLTTELYVLTRNRLGHLAIASDALKKNLAIYLNEYRLISDAVDILDATVVNYGVEYIIVVTPGSNKEQVLGKVSANLGAVTGKHLYQIDQPLIEADFINAIINTPGVLSLQEFMFFNKSGLIGDTQYSSYPYDLESNKFKGMIVGPPGSMFEMLNPGRDIVGSAD